MDRLLHVPACGLFPIPIDDANTLLVEWEHKLGAVHRPFRQEGWAFEVDGKPVAVGTSGSTVSKTVAGFTRGQVVELTRLCTHPDYRWATRVMLRLWREVAAPRWDCWPVLAAVSYSQNAIHSGDIYRFDGWTKVRSDAGKSGGGGAWSRSRYAEDAAKGPKSLWIWTYAHGN